MAKIKWRGDAQAIAQVVVVTVEAEELQLTDTFTLSINGKELTVTGCASPAEVYEAFSDARENSTIPEFMELKFALDLIDPDDKTSSVVGLVITGETSGRPFEIFAVSDATGGVEPIIETDRDGVPAVNKVERISHTGSGGTFTMNHNGGVSTAALAYNVSAAALQTALQGIATIGVGGITVTGPNGGPWDAEWTGSHAAEDPNPLRGDGSSLTGSATAMVYAAVRGAAGVNAKYYLQWSDGRPSADPGGTGNVDTPAGTYYFTFTHPGTGIATEFSLHTGDTRAQMQVKFDTALGVGNVTVSQVQENPVRGFYIEFTNDLGGLDVCPAGYNPSVVTNQGLEANPIPPLTTKPTCGSGGIITVGGQHTPSDEHYLFGLLLSTQGVSTGQNEVQIIRLINGPTGGTFTISFRGATTAAIAYNASNATVKAALEALTPTIVGVTVTTESSGGGWRIEFTNPGTEDLPLMTTNSSSLTGGRVNINVTQTNAVALRDVQSVSLPGTVTGGTFTLDYAGQVTAPIAYNATAATIQAAMEALSNLAPGDVIVTRSATSRWKVIFLGTLLGVDVVELIGDGSSLTIQERFYLETTVLPDGPNWFDEPKNWVGSAIPPNGSEIVYEESAVNCSYGIAYSYRPENGGGVVTSIAAGGSATITTEEPHGRTSGETVRLTGTNCVPRIDGLRVVTVTGLNTFTVPVAVTAAGSVGRFAIMWNRHCNPDKIRSEASYSGSIGLPTWEGDYYEYRPTRLALGSSGYGVMEIEIGYGEGTGSPMLRFDSGESPVLITCWKTASSIFGGAALDWVGSATTNKLRIYRGKVSIALEAGDATTQLSELYMGFVDNIDTDADVDIGPAVVMGVVLKAGGLLRCESALPGETINYAGNFIFNGVGACADLTVRGGTFSYNSNGTLGGNPVIAESGIITFDGDLRSKVVTNPFEIYGDAADVIDTKGVIASLRANYRETTRMPKWGRHFQFTRSAIP